MGAADPDTEVLAQVRQLWGRLDPVPAGLTDRISYALSVRWLQAEIAELSRTPELLARGDRAEITRSLTFSGSTLNLMITAATESDGIRLDCWVTQPGAVVEVNSAGGQHSDVADEHGRLSFAAIDPGPTHFVVWPDESRTGRPIITPIVEL